jgi:hypothetical protein
MIETMLDEHFEDEQSLGIPDSRESSEILLPVVALPGGRGQAA